MSFLNYLWKGGVTLKKSEMVLIVLLFFITLFSLFFSRILTEGEATNLYGQVIPFFGRGVYHKESFFKGPIFLGTDAVVVLLIAVFVVLKMMVKDTLKQDIITLGFMTVFAYYSASLAFGTVMNPLFLAYIATLALSLYHVLRFLFTYDFASFKSVLETSMLPKGLAFYTGLVGLSVLVWLFDIFPVILNQVPSDVRGMSHTEATYVLDLAFVLPSCLYASIMMKKKPHISLILAFMAHALLMAVGLIVIGQTVMQAMFKVHVSVQEMVVFVFSFTLLSVGSFYYAFKSYAILTKRKEE